jgi:WD40 repeat protein
MRIPVVALAVLAASCGPSAPPPPTCACSSTDACCDGCQPIPRALACGGAEGALCREGTCDPAATRVLASLGGGAWVHDLAVSSDGRLLAAAGSVDAEEAAGETIVVQTTDGTIVHRLEGASFGVAFSPDGTRLLVGANPPVLLATSDFGVVHTFTGTVGPVAFSADGTELAVTDGGMVRVHDASDFSPLGSVEQRTSDRERVSSVQFAPDGAWLLTASGQVGFGSPHGDVRIWSLPSFELRETVDCTAVSARVSADGSLLAASCWTNVVLHETASFADLDTVASGMPSLGVLPSSDGSFVAVGGLAAPIDLYDVAAGERFGELPLPEGRGSVRAMTWSGPILYAGGWEGPEIVRIDLTTLEP